MNVDNTRKKTMLIADDIQINRVLLRKVFSDDYNILEAENGVQTLELLRKLPDVAALVLDIVMPELDGFGVLDAMQQDERLRNIPTVVVTASNDEETQINALSKGATDVLTKPFNPQIIFHRVKNIVARKEADLLAEENRAYERELKISDIDEKTGIYNKHAFIRYTQKLLRDNPDKKYIIERWDIDNFKVFNDWFGTEFGDFYLKKVGEFYINHSKEMPGMAVYARYDADHFISCREADSFDPDTAMSLLAMHISKNKTLPFEFMPRMGVYEIDDTSLDVELMCDRALLALRSVKNQYNKLIAWYDDSMRQILHEEQEIINEMEHALNDGQFLVYLQPQYNHDTSSLVGAEALVRWMHPEKGMLLPGKFMPLFERNGFISTLDRYIWEQVCILLRRWRDEKKPIVPISVNISRRDVYNLSLCDIFEELLQKYQLEPSCLSLEITETAYTQNSEQLINIVSKLRKRGLCVHMDDFGSGYSSLNTLKNVPVDLLKLDMRFLDDSCDNSKSDNILNAVVRMADVLKISVLAEGVETKEQADFLKSIGCLLMQGYYFAKPMSVENFEALMQKAPIQIKQSESFSQEYTDSVDLLSTTEQSALLFNSFIGGAAIIEFDKNTKQFSVLRLNDRFLQELCISRTEYLKNDAGLLAYFNVYNRKRIISVMERAAETRKEVSGEILTKVTDKSGHKLWLRVRTRLLSENNTRYILYMAIENISRRKMLTEQNIELAAQFRAIVESIPGGVANFEVADQPHATFINDRLAEMFGYTRKEFTKLFADNPYLCIHSDDVDRLKKNISSVLSGEKDILSDFYRHLCKNGEWRWVQITGRMTRRERKRAFGSVIVIDVHDKMQGKEFIG